MPLYIMYVIYIYIHINVLFYIELTHSVCSIHNHQLCFDIALLTLNRTAAMETILLLFPSMFHELRAQTAH